MKNCIFTELKREIDNNNLPYLDANIYEIVGQSNAVYNKLKFYGCSVLSGTVYSDSECTTAIAIPNNLTDNFYIKPGDTIKVKVPFSCWYIYCMNPTFTANLLDFANAQDLVSTYLRFSNTSGELKTLIEQLSELEDFAPHYGFPYWICNLRDTNATFNGNSAGEYYIKRTDNIVGVYSDTALTTLVASYNTTTKTWTFN